jgi:hypothetical protein
VVARAHQCAACDLAICGLCAARRSLASTLTRITAATTSPSKITQAHAVSRADDILLMQTTVLKERSHRAAYDRSSCFVRREPGRKAMSGASTHSAFASARNKTRALSLMLPFQVNSGTEGLARPAHLSMIFEPQPDRHSIGRWAQHHPTCIQ